MMMANRNRKNGMNIYLIIGWGLVSLMLITDRLWHVVPDWLCIIIAVISPVLMGVGLYRSFKEQKKRG